MNVVKEWDVIAIGDVSTDLIMSGFAAWPRPGEEAFANSLGREIGGGAAITACGLARLGVRTALLAIVGGGDDKWLVEKLNTHGVDTGGVRRHLDEPGGLTVSVSTPHDRSFFTYAGANRALSDLLSDITFRREIVRARHVHLACAPEAELLLDLTHALHAEGTRVSLDTGWHESWLTNEGNLKALAAIDLLMPNENEAQAMTGATSAEAMLRIFAEMNLRSVALKLGAGGAALLWSGKVYKCEAHPVGAIDTTGAGDCFNAGFIYGWLQEQAPEDCLRLACICGALSTRSLGGVAAFPTLEELTARC